VREHVIEISVGFLILAGLAALLILALEVSGLSNDIGNNGYIVKASFDNIGDLKVRAPVSISGVKIGQVQSIDLDRRTFKAIVQLRILPNQNNLPSDTAASILTQGLLGANYISLTPGFDETFLKNGSVIQNTHPALILENLIGQMLFKFTNSDSKNKANANGERP
jgi:phospholipid/cholesterol/gamma-HCH transport system substrate-binding protein